MLEIRKINKTFNAGTVNAKHALKDLSLTLNDGDFVTVLNHFVIIDRTSGITE